MQWMTSLAWVSLGLGFASAFLILIDILRGHPQKMWVMNVVWPITALYSGPLGVWAYFRMGRSSAKQGEHRAMSHGGENHGQQKPLWQQVAVAATHCGSGCTLGDIAAESVMIVSPVILLGRARI